VSARNPKILVCDDDGIRGMLLAFLDGEGFEVAGVGDGPPAWPRWPPGRLTRRTVMPHPVAT
jgi:CheY-like chemotaxis protein